MFDLEKIMELTADELLIANGLQEVAREAKQHVTLIHKAYEHAFGIGERKILIWNDECNAEYITHEGVWQARYLHQKYDVKVDLSTIFDFYRAEWLIKEGYVAEGFEDGGLTAYGKKKQICNYFRAFVKRLDDSFQSNESSLI